MVAGAGKSSATKNSGNSPALISTVVNSKKRKSDRNPTNVPVRLNEPLFRRLSAAAAVTRSFLETNDLFLPPSQSLRLESLLSSLPIAPPSPSTSASTWFHRFLISAVEDDDPRWYLCFRMSKSTFLHLLSILSPSDSPPSLPSSSLAAAIFRLAHNASYKSLVLRFGFDSIPDASRAFFTVCKLISEKLGKIDDPKPDFSPRLLPNCCGVLGFGRFEVDGKLLGSKGSVIVQALVDSSGRFSDISAGWPSTMKPEAIFRQTKLFSIAEETESESGSFLNGSPCKLVNGISVPPYVLGDSCLPLLPWLVIPYNSNEEEDSLESSRAEFNNVVHTALRNVEIAFAKVRARWQILDRKWKPETIEFLPFVVTTGCLLHNFLVDSGDDDLPEDWVNGVAGDNGEMSKDEEGEEEMRRFEGEAFTGSRRIRNAIAENLSHVIQLR
ncbi:protein ALP1-like [Eutrema salsugineum]|uniref:protein ALP1-like n=1 Tax=Eutrema salsugineum TaxID=72664 RepID=UPI000CECFA4D|nr:protein ALP1-like [Eutrema salsugineum]